MKREAMNLKELTGAVYMGGFGGRKGIDMLQSHLYSLMKARVKEPNK